MVNCTTKVINYEIIQIYLILCEYIYRLLVCLRKKNNNSFYHLIS
jgi:hypothetical protein